MTWPSPAEILDVEFTPREDESYPNDLTLNKPSIENGTTILASPTTEFEYLHRDYETQTIIPIQYHVTSSFGGRIAYFASTRHPGSAIYCGTIDGIPHDYESLELGINDLDYNIGSGNLIYSFDQAKEQNILIATEAYELAKITLFKYLEASKTLKPSGNLSWDKSLDNIRRNVGYILEKI